MRRTSQQTNQSISAVSVARDDPNQWLVYADGGRGVCLGLRIMPERLPRHPAWITKLMPVEYSQAALKTKLQTDLERFCAAVENPRVARTVRKNVELGLGYLRVVCAAYSISTKDARWATEQEVRNIVIVRQSSLLHSNKLNDCSNTVGMRTKTSGRIWKCL